MSTLREDAASALQESAMRTVAPQFQEMLGTKDLMEQAVRAVAPQFQEMLGTKDLIEHVDWDVLLSSSEVQ